MKKILIITLEFPPQVGGIATYVRALADELDHDVVVYAPYDGNTKEWDAKQPYKIIRKKPLFPRFMWPRWIRMVFQVWRIVRKEKIEVILLHHVLPVGYVGLILKKITGVPYLIFSHGTDLLMGTRTPWKKKMMSMVANHSTQLVFNSQSLKDRFLLIFPEFESKSIVVYPCPDRDFSTFPSFSELHKLKEQYALEGKKVILSIARFDEGKGMPHLIRLLPDVLKKVPNAVWLLIGDGPKKAEAMKLIHDEALQNVVRYVGPLPHDKLKPFYYSADVFVLLLHPDEGREEGLGMVFLEAAACGIPAVAGKSGGVEEAVIHTETGLVFDVRRDVKAITEGIVQILSHSEFGHQLGRQAQERMQTSFKWEHQVGRLKPWIE